MAGTRGYVEVLKREGRHDFFKLKYGKAATIALLTAFYADPNAPCLERKRKIWTDYSARRLCAEGGT